MNYNTILPVVGATMITFCANCTSHQSQLFKSVRQKAHKAVTPARITFPEVQYWYWKRHDAVNKRLQKGNVDILFVGNSIMHGWEETGKKSWNRYFARYKAVNMGFGWDWTQHTLWRLDHSAFDSISPKLAVVLIGTNNSNGEDNTAREIADGIIAVCDRLHNCFPKMKILLLGIFPREYKPCPQRTKVMTASLLASEIADNKHIYYMDLSSLFIDKNNFLKLDLMPDSLHPNEAGYQVWAESMAPKIAELMNNDENSSWKTASHQRSDH